MSNEAVVPNKVPFTFFAALVRDIQGTVRRKLSNDKRERHNVALQVFARWKEKLYKEFSPLSPGTTAIIFRLLFPDVDFRRRYHMQEKALSLEIMECFGTNDARLRNWSKDGHSGCLGQEVKTVLEDTVSIPDGWVTTLSLQDVDRILDELASLSPWSHASVTTSQCSRRSRKEILKSLFRPLSPLDASVMTQIILRDLHCLLYPVPSDQSTTEALNSFNSSSFKKLTIEDAIRVWDPKNIMFKAYKGSSSLDEASIAFEGGKWMHSPKVGSFVSIPKSYKARSATDALQVFKSSDLIYAETKYDGERTQIHVEILDGLGPRLTIYSKSHRESTSDRIALHPIIIRCLGLNGPKPKIKKDVILDAEMVAFDGLHIDEFWKIHGLVETTATGVRSKPYRKTLTRYSSESRHLGLVFFDILCMDGASLLSVPYWKRRIILEDLIITEPGMALLSTRWALSVEEHVPRTTDLRKVYQKNSTLTALCNIFVERTVLYHEEGLILKGSNSRYNDTSTPWAKLKRDYIPGLGDNVDLVLLGASWDKERGRELGVPTSTYTAFYIGIRDKASDLNVESDTLPHFHIYCVSTYVISNNSREALERLNFVIKSDGLIPFAHEPRQLPYTFSISPALQPPTVLLIQPLVVEVLGDRFTKANRYEPYEPRHPRILKWFRPSERSWRESLTRLELEKIVVGVLGLDNERRTEADDEDEWASRLWGASGSWENKAEKKRKREIAAEAMLEKLSDKKIKRIRMTHEREDADPWCDLHAAASLGQDKLDAVTVVGHSEKDTVSASQHKGAVVSSIPVQASAQVSGNTPSPKSPLGTLTNFRHDLPLKDGSKLHKIKSPLHSVPTPFQHCSLVPENGLQTFFKDAVIWHSGTNNFSQKSAVRQSLRLHTIDALLSGCGWRLSQDSDDNSRNGHWSRGIIIVDLDDVEGRKWRDCAVKMIHTRTRSSSKQRKPIWIFNSRTLNLDASNLEQQALLSFH